ncbi:hypothetical protein [Agrococcus jejuensis]|uniref:hypothetical protein n=1 Tax=Agrococcus jejuensis TaxID=399736 RepID=UPI0011A2DB47|nr:hypothetical protein [Agrococcus jejuensis]
MKWWGKEERVVVVKADGVGGGLRGEMVRRKGLEKGMRVGMVVGVKKVEKEGGKRGKVGEEVRE